MMLDEILARVLTLSVENIYYLSYLIFYNKKEMNLVFYHAHANQEETLFFVHFFVFGIKLILFYKFQELVI